MDTYLYETPSDAEESPPHSTTFLGAFLYPLSTTALIRIGVISLVVSLMGLFERAMPAVHAVPVTYFQWGLGLIGFLIGADFFFYLADCVRSSAAGATRAEDEVVALSGGYAEIFEDFARLVLPYLVCFLPSMIYLAMTGRRDGIFWGLLGGGTFYFPMFLLAVVLFDSGTGYNPILHLVSIACTFFSYCLLAAQVLLVVGLLVLTAFLLEWAGLLALMILPVELYFMILFAHLLGRFYFLHEKQLRWEV